MLLPLKILAPAQAVEHMADWSAVSLSLGIEKEGGDDYAVGVVIVVNPKLSEALQSQSVKNPEHVGMQVLDAARKALEGFLGGESDPRHEA